LGALLQAEPFEMVLCHGDAHAANLMLDQNGVLYLVDWDTPRIAPRERDLLFIVGSTIARRVTSHEETCFFQGYGAIPIHWPAMTYYRYERVLEELYEGGRSVFLDSLSSVAVKEADARFTMRLFQPGALVQSALEANERLND
jgi:spectinomycin phosphotransferase